MWIFLLRRLGSLVLVLFAVVTLTFFLIRLIPGGPFDQEKRIPPAILEQIMRKYRLSGPAWLLYRDYLWDVARGDLRVSTQYRDRSVNEIIAQTLPVSGLLGALAFLVATVAGVWLGTVAATHHGSRLDAGAMLAALLAISVPAFITGPLAIIVCGLWLKILPVGGWGTLRSLVLPALVLAAPYVAYVARLMRSSLLETLDQDFIRTARAKGLAESAVVSRHALKVAILPVVSFLGPLAANLLTGSLVVESIFHVPGMGRFFVNSVLNLDSFLLGGVVIVYCVVLVLMNLAVDVTYTVLDPRVRLR